MRFVRLACPLLFLCWFAAGCQRLDYNKPHSLAAGIPIKLTFTAPKYNQKVTVKVSSSNGPVSAYLVKSAIIEEVANRAQFGQKIKPEGVLGQQENAENISFTADAAKGEEYGLVLMSKKNTEARVEVTGR